MATKREELSNPNSCLNKAEDDEPIFVFKARDCFATVAVLAWVEALTEFYVENPGQPISPKLVGAIKDCCDMVLWRRARGMRNGKVPD